MRYLEQHDGDDPAFLAWADAVFSGAVTRFKPQQFYVVKIDNWFGKRWMRFSGKALGALGTRMANLTLPPFVPSRVVAERLFAYERSSKKYQRAKPRQRLHVYQRSGNNLQRRVNRVAAGYPVFWYSGNSARNGRASLMAYVPTDDEYWPWYLEAVHRERWRIAERVGITKEAVDDFEHASWEKAPGGPGKPSFRVRIDGRWVVVRGRAI